LTENLIQYLHTLGSVTAEGLRQLEPVLSKRSYHKHELLLKEGEVCRSLFFIEQGYCRSYYQVDGLEKNTGFFFENDIATNIQSFGSGEKSLYNIIACEPLTVVVWDKGQLFRIAGQSAEIESLGRSCLRRFAAKQEEQATLTRIGSTIDKLEYIEQHHPHLLRRVPLSQLASFLGVTRETLSRARKRRTSR
jgi:CRP-like cAMP-binding protein